MLRVYRLFALAGLLFLSKSPLWADPPAGEASVAVSPQTKSPPPKCDNAYSCLGAFKAFMMTSASEPPSPPPGPKKQAPATLAEIPQFKKIIETVTSIYDAATKDPGNREAIIKDGMKGLNDAAAGVDKGVLPPEVSKALNNNAAALNNQARNFEKAKAFSDSTLEQFPEDKDALISRSNANLGLGQYDRALADADRAAKLYPQSAEALSSRAMAAFQMHNYQQTMEDARRALALNPNDKTAFSLMQMAEGRIKPEVNLDPAKRAQEASVQREYDGSLQQLSQVEQKRREPLTEVAPPSTQKLIADAAAKIAIKDYWGALADADKAIAESPGSAQAFYYRAAANNLLGKYDEAAKDATLALALNPNDAEARDARTWAFYNLKRYKEAVADADAALELNPKNAYAYARRGYAREKLGEKAAMLKDLKTAASLNPQFEPEYRDAAGASRVDIEPLPETALGRLAPRAKIESEKTRRDSFLTVLVCSVIGGFLIAMGIVHTLSAQWSKKITTEVRRAQEAIASSRPPSAIDQSYEMGRVLGQGGMGVVYEAVDKALKRKVAVKVLRPELKNDARERERFLEEARTVAALHHPAIVDIHSIVEDQAGLYLVFEYMPGKSVDQILGERHKLTLTEAKAILKHVCQALDFAHRHNVVHRDLKPSNIMITDDGEVKVMDFGIARQAKDSMAKFSVTNTVIGTPHYMAPEQEAGVVRKESDIFSLGACLYEMVTGERPYPGPAGTPVKLAQDYPKPSRRTAGLPPELDALIDGALQPDPDKRIRTPKEFWLLLERIKA